MTQVRFSRDAADYVRRELRYLKRHSPSAARNFSGLVNRAKVALQTFQGVGNTMHGLKVTGGLTLVIGDYLFDYTADNNVLDVLSIHHGRMLQLNPELDDPLDAEPEFAEPNDGAAPKF